MTEYGIAWLVVVGGGLLALAFWFLITRNVANPVLRTLLRCLAAVWMLIPAPVPGYPGQYAPAYVVALFEAVFQGEGNPTIAFAILAGGTIFALLMVLLWAMVRRSKSNAINQPDNEIAKKAGIKPQQDADKDGGRRAPVVPT